MAKKLNPIINRLIKHGMTFERQPVRFHCQNHGDLRDTFLVDETFYTGIKARWENLTLIEVAKDSDTPMPLMMKSKIYVSRDPFFSPYGHGFWLSINPPEISSELLFVMDPE